MATFQCSACGREIKPADRCPHCGAEQPQWVEHLAEIERSIAEMKAREAAIAREQRQIAAKMQAALFQRDILAHAGEERTKQATRPHRVLRRRPGRRPPTAATGAPTRVPRQGAAPGSAEPPPPPPPVTWLDVDDPEHPPEASSREVQNIPLGLGALLLGVAAVVFAAVATSSMDALVRLGILLVATVLLLLAPPVLARRGLTSTAETIATVGLLLVPLAGYALWAVDRIGDGGASGTVFAGLIFLVTAAVSVGYAAWTGLRAPRFATVLAAQPVVPLLAYDRITGPAGWALVLTVVALLDLWLARSGVAVERPVRRDLPEPPPTSPAPPPTPRQRPAEARPEGAPEEAGEVVSTPDPTDTDTRPRPVPGLRGLTWVLHGVAVAIALAYAVTALLRAGTVPAATGAGLVLLLAAVAGLAGALALRRPPLPDLGAGILTLAVIGALSRVASVALPGRALLLIAAVIAITGVAVRALPEAARRGPQLASAVALTVSGLLVAGNALRAGVAPVRAALPAWAADLDRYPAELAAAVGPAAWQLAASAFLLTVAAVLALPPEIRREFAVAGTALTALAVPASFGLSWTVAPWPMVLAAVGIGVAGLSARTPRAALAHGLGAAVVGLFGAGAALARPTLTAAVLVVLFLAGVLVAVAPRIRIAPAPADIVSAWAAGGAAFALPGAVAAFVAATTPA
ncbi:permease, partial [Micromonospora sp. 15K316]